MSKGFPVLHMHSSFSDGSSSYEEIKTICELNNIETIALTDHGTLAGLPEFSNYTRFIAGVEAYLRHENDNSHITILADGFEGYKTLCSLNNKAHQNKLSTGSKKPFIELNDLFSNNKDIVVLSGCFNSIFNNVPESEGRSIASAFKKYLGDRFYSECMIVTEKDLNPFQEILHKDFGFKQILTNDVHFAIKGEEDYHNIVNSIKYGFKLDKGYEHLYIHSTDDIFNKAKLMGFENAFHNTYELANKLNPFKIQNDVDTNAILRRIFNPQKSLRELIEPIIPTLAPEYQARALRELSVIESLNFENYFLALNEILNIKDISLGAGRGSAAGSLVLYLLGLTQVDPIKFNLLFERFINSKRVDFPDVDTDIEPNDRELVIERAKTFGAIPISTYQIFGKNAIHDTAKQLRIPKDLEEEWENGIVDNVFTMFPEAERLAEKMETLVKNSSLHAAGIVFTENNIPIPMEVSGSQLVSAFTESGTGAKNLQKMGLTKFDILGLSTLAILKECHSLTGVLPPNPSVDDISTTDKVWELFAKGDTQGVFQFTKGSRKFSMELKPKSIEDLAFINAYNRPAVLSNLNIKLSDLVKNPIKIHPIYDDITKETYGVLLYQEMLMMLWAKIHSSSTSNKTITELLEDGDIARKVFTKKGNDVEIEKYREEFVEAAKNNHNIDTETATKMFDIMRSFSGYGFNKSHAIAYSFISWYTAWYKTYYPKEFYVACLNNDERISSNQYIFEALEKGIEVSPPNVRFPKNKYSLIDGKIAIPLNNIKGIGEKASNEIEKNIPDNGYESLEQFVALTKSRAVNAKIYKILFILGAFKIFPDGYNYSLFCKAEDLPTYPIGSELAYYEYLPIPNKRMMEFINSASKDHYVGFIVDKQNKNYNGHKLKEFLLTDGNSFKVEEEDYLRMKSAGRELKENILVIVEPTYYYKNGIRFVSKKAKHIVFYKPQE